MNRIINKSKIEPIFIKSLSYGFNMLKRKGNEPTFEIWAGTNSNKDFIHRFDNFSDAVKFLLKSGNCSDYKEAIKLLNSGDQDDQ